MQPTPELIQTYTEGACHAFAVVLARRTGWSLVALVDDARGYDGAGTFPIVAHVLVADPRDTYWDVRGRHSLDELKAAYPDLERPRLYHFADERELLEDWSGDSDSVPLYRVSPADLAEARAAVDRVYPQYAAARAGSA